MERVKPTRSGLFAIELLISIGIFSFCAAVAIGLFVQAEIISQDSSDLNYAINAGRSVSEIYKAANGDLQETASMIDTYGLGYSSVSRNTLTMYYNEDWRSCKTSDRWIFRLELIEADSGAIPQAKVSVYGRTGETLTGWSVAALGGFSVEGGDIQ